MRLAHALLMGAMLASLFVPICLARMDLRYRDPLPLIVGWLMSMAGVVLTLAVGVVLLLVPHSLEPDNLTPLASHCRSPAEHGSPPKIEALGGLLGGLLLAVVAARATVVVAQARRRRATTRREHLTVLKLAARVESGSPTTLWLDHDPPLAFSLGGRPGTVVATEGLVRHLDPDTVAAVLAHERAHVAGRHHLLIAIADSMRAALPFLLLFRRAPHALRHLVEIAADLSAVHTCGAVAVQAALERVTGHKAPGMALPLGENHEELRLARLRRAAPLPTRRRRTARCSAVGLLATVTPFLTTVFLLHVMTLVACHAPAD
jgi:hypothetical protein